MKYIIDKPLFLTTLVLILAAAEPAQARRHYQPGHGRWLQRDPAEYVDGMNLYEYVASRPLLVGDPMGLWKIYREGLEWANVESEEGDTVDELARMILLDSSEYGLWLWQDEPDPDPCCSYPGDEYEILSDGCMFTVPNTVVIVKADLGTESNRWGRFLDIFRTIRSSLCRISRESRAGGYHVRWLRGPTATEVTGALQDPYLHKFAFGGHGSADGSLVVNRCHRAG